MNQRKFRFKIITRGARTNLRRVSSDATIAVLAVSALSSLSARAETCESLAALALPYTTITNAAAIPAGTHTASTLDTLISTAARAAAARR